MNKFLEQEKEGDLKKMKNSYGSLNSTIQGVIENIKKIGGGGSFTIYFYLILMFVTVLIILYLIN